MALTKQHWTENFYPKHYYKYSRFLLSARYRLLEVSHYQAA